MSIAVLYPRFHHPAIEESYGSWQSQFRLHKAAENVEFKLYAADDPAANAAALVESDYVLVVTDPLLIAPPGIAETLLTDLQKEVASAAVPVSNEADHPQQRRPAPRTYLTLRELEVAMEKIHQTGGAPERLTWNGSDPGAFLCRVELLDKIERPLRHALEGLDVILSPRSYVHRWSSLRGQSRLDLLEKIPLTASSILEFGCGEAPLGEAVKARQECRVVGIELDPKAAAVARKRIDDVYHGDVREIVSIMKERFDFIIGSEIVEHVDDPWSLLADLRGIATPNGRILLSIPNAANASIVNDLLLGRLDYAYIGLSCVGHLRFFTRQSIEELVGIAGWRVVEITPQPLLSPDGQALITALERAGIPHSKDDLTAAGYYVVAENTG